MKFSRKLLIIWALTVSMMHASSHTQTMKMTFDILFPSSHLKNILTTCMQIRESVAVIDQYKNKEEDYAILTDVMIGRITHLQSAIETMLADKVALHTEDVEYLAAIIQFMESELGTVTKNNPSDRVKTINTLLTGIKGKLENALGVPQELQNHLRQN